MIPLTPEGELASRPKAKLRLAVCANCYMWRGKSISPRGFITILEEDNLRLETHTTYRCFGWLLMIPVPFWSSCAASTREPTNQIIAIRLTNLSDRPLQLKGGWVEAFSRKGTTIEVRGNQRIPDAIPAEDSIQFSIGLGDWNRLGWGFELNLSGITDRVPERIAFERFTSTTFGLLYLD